MKIIKTFTNGKKIATHEDVNLDSMLLSKCNVIYPKQFNNYEEALNYKIIRKIIVMDVLLKKVKWNYPSCKNFANEVKYREDTDPCNPNPWYNILSTYVRKSRTNIIIMTIEV